MFNPLDHPVLILVGSLSISWFAAWIGGSFGKRKTGQDEGYDELMFLLGGTLTLLGLIIGFTFSMAVSRYDQRKAYEEQEANAIGTEYVRAELLPPTDASRVRALLKTYLDLRIQQYQTRNMLELRQIDAQTAQLQTQMWSTVVKPGKEQQSPVTALAVSGMNDVLNSQGYTQAAWWNRIPVAGWILLVSISVFCNVLVGYAAHGKRALLFAILPITLSISLFLIADIDSPRTGLIRVHPQNLESLAESLRAQ
jgi:hypothetical protein